MDKSERQTKEFKGQVENKKVKADSEECPWIILQPFTDVQSGTTFGSTLEVDLAELNRVIAEKNLEAKGFVKKR